MWDVHLSGLVYLAGKVGSNNNNNNNKQICIAPEGHNFRGELCMLGWRKILH